MNITGMTDEQKRVAIAEVCGWKVILYREDPSSLWPKEVHVTTKTHGLMLPPNGERAALPPHYLNSLDAALQICEHVKGRWDIIIRRHNAGHWQVEFCEPSHEVSASNESLSQAICDAFLLTLPTPPPTQTK